MKKQLLFVGLLITLSLLLFGCTGNNEEISNIEVTKSAAAAPGGEEFEITKIEKIEETFSVELNKNITINGISVDGTSVEMPSKKNKRSDQDRPFISSDNDKMDLFITKIKNAVLDFSNNKPVDFKGEQKKLVPGVIDISLFEGKGGKTSPVKAFVNIVSKDGLKLSGLVVKMAGGALEVNWPLLDESKSDVFVFADQANKEEIEKEILTKFEEKAKEENFDYKTASDSGDDDESGKNSGKSRSSKKYGEVVITKNNKGANGTEIIVNDCLKISNITLGTDVKFPSRTSKKGGHEFPYVEADKKNAANFNSFISSIKSKKTGKSSEKLAISFVNVRDGKYPKVGFNNSIVISGFTIKDDEVKWPSIKEGKKFVTVIEATDPDFQKEVEDAILKKAKQSGGKKGKTFNKKSSRSKGDFKKKSRSEDSDSEDEE
ncbi:hypothetical protein KA977_15445 [Candidatus Dependentiae bacterium]|nr:hypothetical protein [Candidatus Dependentiae bacterium]